MATDRLAKALGTTLAEMFAELEREREREELLSQVMAVADEHGLDARALKAVVGG